MPLPCLGRIHKGDDPDWSSVMSVSLSWFVLILAGLFEVGWAIGLKYTEGFTRLWPTVGAAVSMVISLGLLGFALRTLPLGTAYAIWSGVGIVTPGSFAPV